MDYPFHAVRGCDSATFAPRMVKAIYVPHGRQTVMAFIQRSSAFT